MNAYIDDTSIEDYFNAGTEDLLSDLSADDLDRLLSWCRTILDQHIVWVGTSEVISKDLIEQQYPVAVDL